MSEIISDLNLKAEAIMRRAREKREAEVRRQQREADAALVRAAGCLCETLWSAADCDGDCSVVDGMVEVHDRRCPVALAAAILEGGSTP